MKKYNNRDLLAGFKSVHADKKKRISEVENNSDRYYPERSTQRTRNENMKEIKGIKWELILI